jgi:hypothetical protein
VSLQLCCCCAAVQDFVHLFYAGFCMLCRLGMAMAVGSRPWGSFWAAANMCSARWSCCMP